MTGRLRTSADYSIAAACERKRWFSEEIIARKVGQGALRAEVANTDRLWPYACASCRGWHLTKHPQKWTLPITSAQLTEGIA